ncbi:plasmid maintenance protein CcdB [Lysobacteraceae bacterium NML93-0792]|nr:plasmid maintenance protein CcdB [Xanthomonadaceae bacterium NML93-0792]PBS14686.1 plasmid maintenance protein CcdB [Xanthomonadaceae bacterium NML93-0793]PBS17676.1 plasmid maintenance protein CcdB [Xanthomonadaceae bacterium NML93-0831]
MSQFCVYANADPASRRDVPCWLNVQSDLIDNVESRVVVPLIPAAQAGPLLTRLMPELPVAGKPMVMDTAQITSVPMQMLGRQVADLAGERLRIIEALDFLTHGI